MAGNSRAVARDSDVPDVLGLRELVGGQQRWDTVLQTLSTNIAEVSSIKDLEARVRAYCPQVSMAGLSAALSAGGGGPAMPEDQFCSQILPGIVNSALRLASLIGDGLTVLKQLDAAGGETCKEARMSRELCHCLVANMFLCTFTEHQHDAMPDRSFQSLLRDRDSAQEMAKLRMFVHYFERTAAALPRGELRLTRRAVSHDDDAWSVCQTPLLPIEVPRCAALAALCSTVG